MKYDNDFLKTLYDQNSLDVFLSSIDINSIEDRRMKAIIASLKRSISVLDLEFNPIPLNRDNEKVNSHA